MRYYYLPTEAFVFFFFFLLSLWLSNLKSDGEIEFMVSFRLNNWEEKIQPYIGSLRMLLNSSVMLIRIIECWNQMWKLWERRYRITSESLFKHRTIKHLGKESNHRDFEKEKRNFFIYKNKQICRLKEVGKALKQSLWPFAVLCSCKWSSWFIAKQMTNNFNIMLEHKQRCYITTRQF